MGFAGFTTRELEVIALRTNGVNTKEIAARLGFKEPRYVNDLIHSVYKKAGIVPDIAALTRWAMDHGLDDIEIEVQARPEAKPSMKGFFKAQRARCIPANNPASNRQSENSHDSV